MGEKRFRRNIGACIYFQSGKTYGRMSDLLCGLPKHPCNKVAMNIGPPILDPVCGGYKELCRFLWAVLKPDKSPSFLYTINIGQLAFSLFT